MKKLIIGLLLTGINLWGQSGSASTSIYQVAFTNVTTGIQTPSFRNIGQTSHFVSLTFSDAPTKTCLVTGNLVQAGLEYSFDQTTWITFGTPNRATLSQFAFYAGNTITFYGSGAFPFVRFNLTFFDTVNCTASAYYTGASNTASFINGSVFTGSYVTASLGSDSFPALAASLATVSNMGVVGTGGIALPLLACDQTIMTPTSVAAGTFHILAPQASRLIYVCGITATSVGVATVQIVQGAGASCTTPAGLSPQFNLVAGVPLNIGGNLGTLYKVTQADDLCMVTTGANVALQLRWMML